MGNQGQPDLQTEFQRSRKLCIKSKQNKKSWRNKRKGKKGAGGNVCFTFALSLRNSHRKESSMVRMGMGKAKDDNPGCFGTYPEKP